MCVCVCVCVFVCVCVCVCESSTSVSSVHVGPTQNSGAISEEATQTHTPALGDPVLFVFWVRQRHSLPVHQQ